MKRKFTTKRIVYIALFASICFVGTWLHIPIHLGGSDSMIHLGTTAIFLSALFLGSDAGLAGGIGCALFDATNPKYATFIIPTFIIKGFTGYVVGKIAYSKGFNGNNVWLNIGAFIAGGIVSLLGYFIINWFIFVGFYAAVTKLITSITTTAIAIGISVPLIGIKPVVDKAINVSN